MQVDKILNNCSNCGDEAEMIMHHVKGTVNRLSYFVRCIECGKRQVNSYKRDSMAIESWNTYNKGVDDDSKV